MMADTISLAALIVSFLLFLIFIAVKPTAFSKRKILLINTIFLLAIIPLFLFTGFKKLNADISRIIKNSAPKTSNEVYSLLFKKPIDSCVATLNFKDQIVPKVDCCIWMELQLCPNELVRITKLKKYQASVYSQSDSLKFLKPFNEKPTWWAPQVLGDTIYKLSVRFDNGNEQTLFFGGDSSHVYLCDQAL